MTFAQFWRDYLKAHSHAGTRALHYAGTAIGFVGVIIALFKANFWIALIGVVVAYLLAWTGHLFFEKNRPSVFQHPIWSFIADFRMLWSWLTRRLDNEFRKYNLRD